jgi:hypothetical protein
MQSSNTGRDNKEPLSDLAFDWVTIIQHKSEALRAYEQYIKDAQSANSSECADLMRKMYEADARHVQEATQHLMHVLQGRMGQNQGQMGQGQMGQDRMGGQMGQASQGQMGDQDRMGKGQSGGQSGQSGGQMGQSGQRR